LLPAGLVHPSLPPERATTANCDSAHEAVWRATCPPSVPMGWRWGISGWVRPSLCPSLLWWSEKTLHTIQPELMPQCI
jgi:hypothetical protein